MVLSDGEIYEALDSGELGIDPFPPDVKVDAIQASSIDLRLDSHLSIQKTGNVSGIELYPPDLDVADFITRFTDPHDLDNSVYPMKSSQFVIGKTLESVRLPLHFAGRLEGKSSLARLGVGVHITAPKIDPGFDNQITLEMFNFGPFTVQLKAGMNICVLIVERLGKPAKQGYTGRFQG